MGWAEWVRLEGVLFKKFFLHAELKKQLDHKIHPLNWDPSPPPPSYLVTPRLPSYLGGGKWVSEPPES